MVIKSYQDSLQDLENAYKKETQAEEFEKMARMINKNQRISDFFLKYHYQRQSSILGKQAPKAAPASVTTAPKDEESS